MFVCLVQLYEPSEPARLLEPPCKHVIHDKCLRAWLYSGDVLPSKACPVCRGPAAVTDCVQLRVCRKRRARAVKDTQTVTPLSEPEPRISKQRHDWLPSGTEQVDESYCSWPIDRPNNGSPRSHRPSSNKLNNVFIEEPVACCLPGMPSDSSEG